MTPAECVAVVAFLTEEHRKRHIEYEVLLRDRAALVRQHSRNPMSVRPDRLETAESQIRRVHDREVYLGELLGAFPAAVRDSAVSP